MIKMSLHYNNPPKIGRFHLLDGVNSKTFTPREYQVELLDAARKRNTIVCLGTGSGKTFIAVMLVKELAHETRLSLEDGGKRTFFIVPTSPLIHQQSKVLQDHTDLKIGKLYGTIEVSSPNVLLDEIRNNNVIVSTPDLFRLLLYHDFLSLSRINLLILDECHKAVGNHSYCQIMRCFNVCADHPRVLGLSASLVNGKCKPERLENEIKNLERMLKSTVETASELTMLSKYGSKPREFVVEYKQYFSNNTYFLYIIRILNESFAFLDDFHSSKEQSFLFRPCKAAYLYISEVSEVFLSLGPWCTMEAITLFCKEIYSVVDVIDSQNHKMWLIVVVTILSHISLVCDRMLHEMDESFNAFCTASPKLKVLLKLLIAFKSGDTSLLEKKVSEMCPLVANEVTVVKTVELDCLNSTVLCNAQHESQPIDRNTVDDNRDLCCVIFVRQRVTAFLLNQWLSEVSKFNKTLNFISSNYIIGHGKNRGITLPSHKQEEVLRKFKAREYNIIVTTSVVEEGLDIPRCNLVIRFDAPENFCSYIQSKGRARALDSSYIVMVGSDQKEKFARNICDFKVIEQTLLEKSHRADIADDNIQDLEADEIMEPYVPVKEVGFPRVTLSSAIALVNRYCAKLPSDTFTRLTPKWEVSEVLSPDVLRPLYLCFVQLPINSPVKKSIVGDHMPSKQLAKMSAALKTCKELHIIGELDHNLLPTGKETMKFREDIDDSLVENENAACALPGTTKRRQYYFKQVAEVLKNSKPSPGMPTFLYLLRMILTCPLPDDQNTRGRKLHDPATTSRNFGILLRKRIPPICSFPVFTRSGEVTVHIDQLACNLFLNEVQLEEISHFHQYTFSDVLRLEKYPMMYSPLESELSFFIVPVNKCQNSYVHSIDWEFINTINAHMKLQPKKMFGSARDDFKFAENDYIDAVVMPWYRNLDKPQFFYVAEICSYLTPLSNFPDDYFETFKGYYEKKYHISVRNLDQPLLDVDHTSARLNLLTPRYVNRKGVTLPTSSENTKKTKRENLQQKQILIPELCIIHPFPASLWRKAVCLPCILYRTNSLLLAEQLRSSVAQSILVGPKHLPGDFQWPPLDFGWTLADVIKSQVTSKDRASDKKQPKTWTTEKHVVNKKVNKITGPDDVHANNSDEKQSAFHYSNDFEIDVFDPSKLDIPSENSFDEPELCDIDFCTDCSNPLCIPVLDNSQSFEFPISAGKPEVRYGSPSNFETICWDFDQGCETNGSNFWQLNMPDLLCISAPGIFNMESLSMDLTSQQENNELWDSLDENSSSDDLEFTHSPSVHIGTPEEGFKISDVEDTEEPLYSDWLSLSSVQDNSLEEESFATRSETSLYTVASKQEYRKGEVRFLSFEESDTQISPSICFDFTSLVEKTKYFLSSDCFTEHTAPNFSRKPSLQKGDIFTNSPDLEVKNELELAFGELLRNRDKHGENDSVSLQTCFDSCPNLNSHPGPSPSIILQACTMSNANDGINLERLETVGDSFLKYAITAYLFCMYPNIHEGKLSFLRSKQISNLNLYRLGKKKNLGELMVATKFEPSDNWLPPCYIVPKGLEEALIESGLPISRWNISNINNLTSLSKEEIRKFVVEEKIIENSVIIAEQNETQDSLALVPYNLLTQHSIPDKSIADCVEALIGAYLVSCGTRGALLFMSWLGLHVLPSVKMGEGEKSEINYGYLDPPSSPLLTHVADAHIKLESLLSGYSAFEKKIGYIFQDKAYLLQAFTHASYNYNTLTDCYQRLEFLGDAVLDYLITKHLYEDPKKHSPGTLTDLRSALVNNTFFASLAVKYDFHKYFKAISPSLFSVINRFVELKEHSAIEDYANSYYLEEDECEEAEEVEVPKALGDIFESVAGALYLDSGMSLDAVWNVYYSMMKPEIEYFSNHAPKSPIRELLELEPQTAKFEKAEMTLSGKVRVRVEVFGKGYFVGIGRNKRIAKCTAAKRALRELKKLRKFSNSTC